MKLLVVEDDKNTAELLRAGLSSSLHTVDVALDGADGAFLARNYEYDSIVLDYSLPKKDGLAVCREIRSFGKKTPIIFLSVNDDVSTKVAAFESGADDYVTKPFSLEELNARLKNVYNRPDRGDKTESILEIEDVSLNIDKSTVSRHGSRIRLTRKEFMLLEYLMRNRGKILSRSLLMEHVWTADNNPFSNTVETHIRNLRKKLNQNHRPDLIKNIPGRGYVIDTLKNLRDLM